MCGSALTGIQYTVELVHGMELRSLKGCIDLHESQVNTLGRQQLLEHFDLQSTNISR